MSLEMMKRNRTYGERICPFNETASECAQNSIGATRLGRNWKEIRQSMKLGIVRRATKVTSSFLITFQKFKDHFLKNAV